ncbi:gamma carbonic anhydrase family protein [Bacteroidota bacterium]
MDIAVKSDEARKEENLFPYKNFFPNIDNSVFIAPGVKVIGDVTIKENSSIWYNTVIRGDIHYIKIGSNTNIQDGCMLHVTADKFPISIGDNVTVGHNVTLHGCTIKNNALIGMGAILLDGSLVNENSIVAAGSVVKEGFIVPKGKLVAGIPAGTVRDVKPEEIEAIKNSAAHYVENAYLSKKSLNDSNFKND